jgi:hypothetical protein
MSIPPIGGPNPALATQSLQPAVKPEDAEQPGAPDHDGDSDDGAVKVTLSKQS